MTTAVAVRPHLRGWSHALACVAALALCPIAIVASPGARIAVGIFTGAVVGLFAISGAYHRLFWGTRAHEVFRRLDHAMIFVAIAATYTPLAVVALAPGPGNLILAVVWTGAGIGVLSQILWPHAPRALLVVLYGLVGWAALLVIDDLWTALGVAGFTLLLVGGVLHTIGAVVYAIQRPNPWPRWFGFHEIFHLLVVAAIATHYVAVAVIAV